ncbi:hypothetical protein EHEL_070260 [Encephalitozoon hellem ATCC 50504]|uniref:PHO85 cyclin PHO80 n=1 Tax=Encephalitozoon hellem TaxID=27973 RepID=A0A9Q9C3J1_ENCHE|nr:uncharacterized protein EHEL_070260 [Encephalitozoon hellem ATCC 50504]AFM98553.1 hypothetical protein EHEL_070260 [Encephalitozoon hellem ATCC 50504]UTX43496.1 PHO85 cyclin PHO80 [Encephalitozoon hellem]WEL38970.1 PHO85 cyclin PHO80 [Encephalitozoon hellem]|eukprot:XP_003887534.1 hypothetical protein EHEL_070260 [Encephalitozoon hellem ATCC 50504]
MKERSYLYSLPRKKCIKAMDGKIPKIESSWLSEDRQEARLPFEEKSYSVEEVAEERTVDFCSTSAIEERALMKPYVGFPMDEFLSSISERERRLRFNFSLINSVILRFLDHRNIRSILSIESIFRAARELPLVLISGYIYLEKYVKKVGAVFGDCKKLIKFFFGCCFMGSKFIYDTWHPDSLFIRGMNSAEISRIEGLVLSAIDYDLEISNNDIRRVILQNKASLSNKEHLNAQFNRAIRTY